MEQEEKDIVEQVFEDIRKSDASYAEFEQIWGSLSSFLVDYEHLKGLRKLTQAEIAKACGTTQSAISRFERMRGKPTYELLRKISNAVGGELFVTPLADVTITLPYDLHDRVRSVSASKDVGIQDFMNKLLREGIEREEYRIAGGECSMTLISSRNDNIPYGNYSGICTEGDVRVAG